MAEKVIINKSILTDIGNAIREKEESSDLIPSTEMATRIRDFQGGAKIISGGKSAVPVDGTTVVDTIFSDTSKSIEEVDAILSQLTYIDGLLGAGVGSYILFYGTSGYGDNIIFVNKITNPFGDGKDIYTIQTSDSSYLFYQNYDTDGNTFGWLIEDIPNGLRAGAPEFKINMASTTEIQGMPVGAQNELLKDIIYVGSVGVEKTLKGEYNGDSVSITKPENVNISALIDEQKIPLAVNVDIPTYDGEQEGGEPFVNPLQKLIDKTQQVRYLFFQYPDSDLQDVVDSIELTNVKDCQGICYGVKNVESITLNLPNTTDLTYAFCTGNFKKIVVNTTSALTKVTSIIQSCMYLEDFTLTDMKGVSDYQSATNFMFPNGKLVNFKVNNIKVNMTFYSDVLSVESLIYTIQQLIDVGSTRNLTIGSKNLAKIENVYVKLTGEAEEDEANPKLPCEVCNADDEGAMTIIAYANSKNWTIA